MFIFRGDTLLTRDGVFDFRDAPAAVRNSRDLPAVWREVPDWCEVKDAGDQPGNFFAGAEWIDLRELWLRFGEEAFARAGAAYQYMNWMRNARFCSACGAPLIPKEDDKGLKCSDESCGRVVYAPLHPAIIIAIERDGKLLLAHNTRTPGKRYSILAGFVEPGESLERTVEREVMEETGIEVEDVRYFGSQSWPFPCSLMLGFTARWKKGELRPDGTELNDAGWFAPGEFPEIPQPISISRKLIDDFTKRMKVRQAL